MVIIVFFEPGHDCHLDHSHYDNLIMAVRGLRRRPGHPEVFSEPNQEGGDSHEGEEG